MNANSADRFKIGTKDHKELHTTPLQYSPIKGCERTTRIHSNGKSEAVIGYDSSGSGQIKVTLNPEQVKEAILDFGSFRFSIDTDKVIARAREAEKPVPPEKQETEAVLPDKVEPLVPDNEPTGSRAPIDAITNDTAPVNSVEGSTDANPGAPANAITADSVPSDNLIYEESSPSDRATVDAIEENNAPVEGASTDNVPSGEAVELENELSPRAPTDSISESSVDTASIDHDTTPHAGTEATADALKVNPRAVADGIRIDSAPSEESASVRSSLDTLRSLVNNQVDKKTGSGRSTRMVPAISNMNGALNEISRLKNEGVPVSEIARVLTLAPKSDKATLEKAIFGEDVLKAASEFESRSEGFFSGFRSYQARFAALSGLNSDKMKDLSEYYKSKGKDLAVSVLEAFDKEREMTKAIFSRLYIREQAELIETLQTKLSETRNKGTGRSTSKELINPRAAMETISALKEAEVPLSVIERLIQFAPQANKEDLLTAARKTN